MQILLYHFDPDVSGLFHDVKEKDGHIHHNIQSTFNFIAPGEKVAVIIEQESLQVAGETYSHDKHIKKVEEYQGFPCDSSLVYDEKACCFIAQVYGFVIHDINENKFKIIPTIYISKDKMQAFFLLYPGRKELIPTIEQIKKVCANAGILNLSINPKLKDTLKKLAVDMKKVIPILVAQGMAPETGYTEYYDFIPPEHTTVGTVHASGKIDFKERKSFMHIENGQPVLVRHPEIKAVDGQDVLGNLLTAKIIANPSLNPGDGVQQSRSDVNIFESNTGGVIIIKDKTLSIDPLLNISGDVSYETGHIEFDGSVNIKGAILSGFKVKVSGDIIVAKDIEDATVEATGSITVGMGITGSGKSQVRAGVDIKAEYIMNAQVEALGAIEVNESIVNSTVISNQSITVIQKHGKIIGGTTMALNQITLKVAGSLQEVETILEVGKSLVMEQELEPHLSTFTHLKQKKTEIRQKISLTHGEHLMEPVKEEIDKLLPAIKKEYLSQMKELISLNTQLSELDKLIQQIRQKYHHTFKSTIQIEDKAYPGTVIRINDKQYPVKDPLNFIEFYYQEESHSIEYSPLK